jgi:hypothetical protein
MVKEDRPLPANIREVATMISGGSLLKAVEPFGRQVHVIRDTLIVLSYPSFSVEKNWRIEH